jgi:hypothetical protein
MLRSGMTARPGAKGGDSRHTPMPTLASTATRSERERMARLAQAAAAARPR